MTRHATCRRTWWCVFRIRNLESPTHSGEKPVGRAYVYLINAELYIYATGKNPITEGAAVGLGLTHLVD